MNEITSLPESLRQQIQKAASGVLEGSTTEATDDAHRAIIEIARQCPELFALLAIANANYTGLEVVETEETSEDRVVSTNYAGNHYTEVQPMKRSRIRKRQVRFLTDGPGGRRST